MLGKGLVEKNLNLKSRHLQCGKNQGSEMHDEGHENNEEYIKIAQTVVQERLSGCVQIIGSALSPL